MLTWLKSFFGEGEAKKKSKRGDDDYVRVIALKAAKNIAKLTPELMEKTQVGQQIVPVSFFSGIIDLVNRTEKGFDLRFAPVSRYQPWVAYYNLDFDKEDDSIRLYGVTAKDANQVEILRAALGEVIFEYDNEVVDDLEAVSKALTGIERALRGQVNEPSRKIIHPWWMKR